MCGREGVLVNLLPRERALRCCPALLPGLRLGIERVELMHVSLPPGCRSDSGLDADCLAVQAWLASSGDSGIGE